MKQEYTTARLRYQRGYDYNVRLDYYGEVSENIDYLADKQWGNDISKSSMPNPVFNIEKLIQRYKVSSLISPSVSAVYTVEAVDEDTMGEEKNLSQMAKLLSNSASVRWERQKMMKVLRECVEDAWVSGDMCTHTYWDPYVKTNQDYQGDFCTERILPGNVFFGDPNTPDVSKQPYIMLVKRQTLSEVKARAKEYGMKQSDIDNIVPDHDIDTQMGDLYDVELQDDEGKLNVLYTYYREKKKGEWYVYLDESTATVDMQTKKYIKKGNYPIAFGNWEPQSNSYHGRPESSGLHTTQRFINKMYALCMLWMINNAFGKIVYDETRCSGVTNEIGVATPISGPVSDVIAQLRSGDFNTAILQVIDTAIEYTKEFCGLSNAALGQGAAYNTSAIVALGKQAAIQLEGNQARVFQFVEDIYSIWAEFMVEKYATGRKVPIMEDGKLVYKPFDGTMRDRLILNTKIDVGASSVWSEVAAIQTLDNMLLNAILTPIQYIERLPNGVIPNREKLIEELKAVAQMPEGQANMLTEDDNEAMAQFFDSLPAEQQTALKALPADQMEQQIIQMMATPRQPQEEMDIDSIMSQLGGLYGQETV